MARRQRKNEKARRRQREKQSARRAQANVYRRIGEHGDLVACYVNRRWREEGLASLFMLRRIPGGQFAMTAFLIDTWCMGLKDAWGRIDMTMAEFEDMLERHGALEFEEIDFDTARELIVGSVRFAHENGFRLPRRYDRWVTLAGISDNHAEADLQHFRRDGLLVYMGSLDDLRKRLVGASVDQFLERDDVRFAVGIDDAHVVGTSQELVDELMEWQGEPDELDALDQDKSEVSGLGGEQLEDVYDEGRRRIMIGVRRWCQIRGIEPHPMLEQAWDLHELAMEGSDAGSDEPSPDEPSPDEPSADDPSPIEINTMRNSIEALLEMRPAREREPLIAAIEQIRRFVNDFESPDELSASLGVNRNT